VTATDDDFFATWDKGERGYPVHWFNRQRVACAGLPAVELPGLRVVYPTDWSEVCPRCLAHLQLDNEKWARLAVAIRQRREARRASRP
jgi:hypothetical protein